MPAVVTSVQSDDGTNVCTPATAPPAAPVAYAKPISIDLAAIQRFNRCQYNILIKSTCEVVKSAREVRSSLQSSLAAMSDEEFSAKSGVAGEDAFKARATVRDGIEHDYPDKSTSLDDQGEHFAHFKFVRRHSRWVLNGSPTNSSEDCD